MFSHSLSPVLLPPINLRGLIEKNKVFFRGTIYQREADLLYQFTSVYPVLPIEHQGVACVLHVPQIMVLERLPLYCIRNVGRVEGNIHAKAELPKHVVFDNTTLMSVNLTACLKFNQVSQICSAQLHIDNLLVLSEASTCTLMSILYERPEWINGFYGYALAMDKYCQIQKSDMTRPARSIDTSNGFFFVPFNCSAQYYCPPDIHLPLEARRFDYSYYYQQKSPWNFTQMHKTFVINKWTEISNVEELIKQIKNGLIIQVLLVCLLLNGCLLFSLLLLHLE